jgi:alkaline phosphatase D
MGTMVGCSDSTLDDPVIVDDGLNRGIVLDATPDAIGPDAVDIDVAVDTGPPAPDTSPEVNPVDSIGDGDVPPEVTLPEDTGSPESDGAGEEPPVLGTFDPESLALNDGLFPLGVQSGDVLPTGAILWSRYLGKGTTTLKVFQDKAGQANVYIDDVVEPDANGFIHADVTGLIPWMHYRFCVVAEDNNGGTRSAIGRFRTAPAADALVPVVFGGVSCTYSLYKPFKPLLRAAEANLDFFILAGDTSYNDGAETLDEYHDKWTGNLEADGYQALFRSTSMLATWDDHEITNNWDPETTDASQIDAARKAFFQFMAIRPDQKDPDRIWRSYRWGKTVEVFVLDCRGERKPSTRGTPEAQYISPEQMTWLKEGLAASEAAFKVIVNSVPITDMPDFFITANDRWEGYGPQRDEILAHMDTIPGCVWVSGDFHFGAISRIAIDGPGADTYEIYMGPGGQIQNPAYLLLNAQAYKDQFKLATATHNHVRFTADPTATPAILTVEFVDGDGDVFHTHIISG